MKELENRITDHLSHRFFYEAIGLVEDELDEIIDKILHSGVIQGNEVMQGNATILRKEKNGYIIKTDSGEELYLSESSYKGTCDDPETRVRYGKIRTRKDGIPVCVDAMECLSYDELRYQMFSCIEDRDMFLASSYAWAIYEKANEEEREAMKLCIHTLRNYMKKK